MKVLILGGNEGDVTEAMAAAAAMIGERVGVVTMASDVHLTAPWGDMAQDTRDFLNQVLVVETALMPEELLRATQAIECELGRVRPANSPNRYASRTMDIDILFYDDLILNTPGLTIPHPLLHEREFVLAPLAEVLPEFRHPVTGMTVSAMLRASRAGRTRL